MTTYLNRERLSRGRKLKALAAGALVTAMMAVGLLAASPANAATTFTVNSAGDESDANTLDGVCKTVSGACTLRAALGQAGNFSPGADTINFNIPGGGVHTISPASELPTIEETVTIDGYTQPGASPNTLAKGDDAKIMIELDGSKLQRTGDTIELGLEIRFASNNVIRGLAINSFPDEAIHITGSTADGNTISFNNRLEGNFIGTDPSGAIAEGNGANDDASNGGADLTDGGGITLTGATSGSTVGGSSPAARNVISGNSGPGVSLTSLFGTKVQGNYVGTNKDGTADLGNRGSGVEVSSRFGPIGNNTIGGTAAGEGNLVSGNDRNGIAVVNAKDNKVLGNLVGTDRGGTGALGNSANGVSILDSANNAVGGGSPGAANTIAFNGLSGVIVNFSSQNIDKANGNRILSNPIFSNGGLGIDHGGNGVSPNDGDDPTTPQVDPDADSGPNGFQNRPVLSSAKKTTATKTVVKGELNSTPGKSFTVRFFSSPPGGDEGKRFIGQKRVTTNAGGDVSFAKALPRVAVGKTITATATGPEGTSEFSAPRKVAAS